MRRSGSNRLRRSLGTAAPLIVALLRALIFMPAVVPIRAPVGFASMLAGCVLMVGCAGRSEVDGVFRTAQPAPFSPSGEVTPPDRWWSSFGDASLNQRIDEAFGGSYTLAAAQQRVRSARALARREASDFFPDVNGIIDPTAFFGPGEDRLQTVWGLEGGYPIDLWGEIESRVEAQALRASATDADYQAVALVLSADITRTWFALIEAHAQVELLEEQIDTNKTGLILQEARFARGLVRSPDVLRQRQLLESTREQLVVEKSRIEVLEHRLAVLVGDFPQQASYQPGRRLPELPPLPATGLPSELLRRRPDVRRDYLAFQAADRQMAAAISAQYPRLNLTGSVLNVAERPETLFRDWFVTLGAPLIAPLIDGGQRRAEVERTAAIKCELFNQYGQTMLIAFQEVEDSLAREKFQIERLELLNSQVELARISLQQLREQYQIGDTDYLSVLTAVQALQRLQRETLAAQLELRLIRVSLYLAIAGGFDSLSISAPVQTSVSDPDFEYLLDQMITDE